ncbi:hypothetical protein Clos_1355 [Alkaliphilus oremlandii OhILAs]|uniref:Restriction endonuclease type IV Mrr domain-containing protein n=2 Tax=Alkaliphilus oremlandii TaxID=461876 RepID=A8MH13_ALKOO|nr:hypothetical protein Clos_1355 [Alkaliphilus oremlandii OhILAs]
MKKIDSFFKFISSQLKGSNRSRGNSLRFRNYYLSVKDDKRNNVAKIVDYSMWRICLFFLMFIYIYSKINKLSISILISTFSFILVHKIAIKGREHKFQQMKEQKRRYIGSQKVYNEIMNKTTDEMKVYIKKVFGVMGFTELNFKKVDQRHILLNSVYKEEKIMLLFNIYKNDLDVELKEVKEFIDGMSDSGIKKGILITTSDFTKDSYNYIKNFNENYSILLLNKDKFLKIIENRGLFPTGEEIDEMIESKISKRHKNWDKYKKAAMSKGKVKSYIALSIYLIIAAWYTTFTVYYMVISGLILAFAVITFLLNRREEEEDTIDFEKLLNDM